MIEQVPYKRHPRSLQALKLLVILVALVFGAVTATHSSASDGGPAFSVPSGGQSESASGNTSTRSNNGAPGALTYWILQQQRSLHRSLSDSMATIEAEGGWGPIWVLVGLSFFYGIFHAAGPGHGKAVITTYLLTQPTALRRGLVLSVLAALMQGVTAIVLVLSLVFVLGRLAREAVDSVQTVEQISFALVAVLGILLIWRSLNPLITPWFKARIIGNAPLTPFRSPEPSTGYAYQASAPTQSVEILPNTSSTSPPHSSGTEPCPTCGKVHHVSPEQIKDKSLLQSAGLVLAIGVRPCAGAVLVLVVANLLGLWWAGILGVLAMSMGTAITVSALATLAVSARGLATRLLSLQGNKLIWVSRVSALLGGAILIFLGVTLLQGSIVMPRATGIL